MNVIQLPRPRREPKRKIARHHPTRGSGTKEPAPVVSINRAKERAEIDRWMESLRSWARYIATATTFDEKTASALWIIHHNAFGAVYRMEKLLTEDQLRDMREIRASVLGWRPSL